MFLHAYMFRSAWLGFYVMLSFVSFLFLLYVDVGVICSYACMMSLAMVCLDLCVYMLFAVCYA